MQTFEERASRGEYAGHYRGYYYESSFELAWLVYNLDHRIQFSRCNKSFEYYDSQIGKWRLYFPDFELANGTIIEIKGYYTQNTADKMQAVLFDYGRNIVLLEEKDLQTELNYCYTKYGKNFATKLKDI